MARRVRPEALAGVMRNSAAHAKVFALAGTVVLCGACGESKAVSDGEGRIANVTITHDGNATGDHATAASVGSAPRDAGVLSLARAAGGSEGTTYEVSAQSNSGFIVGKVGGGAPRDTSITPTHDVGVCRPFTESLVPSRDGGVGNSVVWLVGMARGPKDDAPRRVRVMLDGCRLEPRVQRIATGGTVMITSRDAMMTRLQFIEVGANTPSRGTVLLSDAGQVVPTSDAAKSPGLVQIRDDLHPWVRAYLAISPHPFVAVTEADGQFRFDNVPPGSYTLFAWHERFGTRQQRVKVDANVETRVELRY